MVFICEKEKVREMIDELISGFYLSEENKILLSDDLEQYVYEIGMPNTGLAILDPESEIWF